MLTLLITEINGLKTILLYYPLDELLLFPEPLFDPDLPEVELPVLDLLLLVTLRPLRPVALAVVCVFPERPLLPVVLRVPAAPVPLPDPAWLRPRPEDDPP